MLSPRQTEEPLELQKQHGALTELQEKEFV
jgi:hypothetical protein